MTITKYIGEATAYDRKLMLKRENPVIVDLVHRLDLIERESLRI